MPNPPPLILASSSPRRRELLSAAGLPCRVIPSRAEESPRRGEDPRAFVRRAARAKGREVAARHPEAFVLSADTIVVIGGRILGKPRTPAEAFRMLVALAGREHRVHTAVCLLREADGYRDERVETTRVRFRPLTREEVRGYLRTGESGDKAGAYAAQGAGSLLIDRIAGSFTNVVGLPMTTVLAMLRRARLARISRTKGAWYRLGRVR